MLKLNYNGDDMKIDNLILSGTPVINFSEFPMSDPRKLSRILKIDHRIIERWNNWVNIDGIWYYYKNFPNYSNPSANFLNELIGEFLANYIELETVNYNIGCMNLFGGEKNYGLLSRSFRKKEFKYITPYDVGVSPHQISLYNLENIRYLCKNDENYKKLVSQLLKMIALDIYMNQNDRTVNNFLFKKKNGNLELAPLYDYERAFFVDKDICNQPIGNYHAYILGLNLDNKEDIDKYPELKELFDVFLSIDINYVLDCIKEKFNLQIPFELRDEYIKYNQKIKSLIKRKIND